MSTSSTVAGFPNIALVQKMDPEYDNAFRETLYKTCLYIYAFFKDLGHNLCVAWDSLFGRVELPIEPSMEEILKEMPFKIKKQLAEQLIDVWPALTSPIENPREFRILDENQIEKFNAGLQALLDGIEALRKDETVWSKQCFTTHSGWTNTDIVTLQPFFQKIKFPTLIFDSGDASFKKEVFNAISYPELKNLVVRSAGYNATIDLAILYETLPSLKQVIVADRLHKTLLYKEKSGSAAYVAFFKDLEIDPFVYLQPLGLGWTWSNYLSPSS